MSFYIEFGTILKYHEDKLETDVVIPDEAEIIGSGAFARHKNLNSVIIPENVVEIGSEAFWSCGNLLYVDIHEGTEKIDDEAFGTCGMLERIKLPNTLKSLGCSVFRECSSLKEIIIPDKVTIIKGLTFYYCSSLAHVTLPKNLTEIGEAAFCECKSLKTIEIPEGVTDIGFNAFNGSGLSRAVIPRNIKTIGSDAFCNTDNLVTNIPVADWQDDWGISKARYALNFMNLYTAGDPFFDNVKEENNQGIKEYLYDIELEFSIKDDIKALRYLIKEELLDMDDIELLSKKMVYDVETIAILLDYKNTHFSAEYIEQWEQDKIDKALGIKEYTYRDWCCAFKLVKANGEYVVEKYRGNDDTVIVPGEINGLPVTAILQNSFWMTENIKSVFIREGITRIDSKAFHNCSLTEITLPETLRSIGENAFSESMNLTEITIPSKVTDIGEDAFRSCKSLVRATLPDKITAIKACTFCNSAIREISIPEGVESIDECAFSCCYNLSEVTLPESLHRIERYAFQFCCKIKKIVLYEQINYIHETAFENIKGLIIAAPVGSYAMDFALDMGYKFEELEPPESKEGK